MNRCLFVISMLLLGCASEPVVREGKKTRVNTLKIVKQKMVTEPKKKDLITNRNVKERLLAYGEKNPETMVLIKTDKGDLKVRLYKDTPLHRANFILMSKEGCFNNTVFTRVSKDFMAQAGGTYDEDLVKKRNGIGKYTVPAEIRPHHIHKRGALGAARSYNNNPDKRSSAYQFYFVEGAIYNDLTLDKYEEENGYRYPKEHREYYKKNPGAAHIDGQHTVFGEVVEGLSVIPKLTHVKTDSRDWPVNDIFIREVIVLN